MKQSRRIVLKSAAVIAGLAAAPWAARPALAQAKADKKAMQYQDQPKNGQKCDTCLQFHPRREARRGRHLQGGRRPDQPERLVHRIREEELVESGDDQRIAESAMR